MFLKKTAWAALLLAGSALIAHAGPVTLADSTADFSSAQGFNGWTYGYYSYGVGTAAPSLPGTFGWSDLVYLSSSDIWYVPPGAPSWLFFGQNSLEAPNGAGYTNSNGQAVPEYMAVRRWTAPTNVGSVTVSGHVNKQDINAGASDLNVYIYLDGSSLLYSHPLVGTDGTGFDYSLVATLNSGDTLDFVLAPAVPSKDLNGTTYFYSTITADAVSATPEPGTVFTIGIGAGLLGLSSLRRKKQ